MDMYFNKQGKTIGNYSNGYIYSQEKIIKYYSNGFINKSDYNIIGNYVKWLCESKKKTSVSRLNM